MINNLAKIILIIKLTQCSKYNKDYKLLINKTNCHPI